MFEKILVILQFGKQYFFAKILIGIPTDIKRTGKFIFFFF